MVASPALNLKKKMIRKEISKELLLFSNTDGNMQIQYADN